MERSHTLLSEALPSCPFCDSSNVQKISAWGGQLITAQLRCMYCNTYFEAVRDDFDADALRDETVV